MITTVKRYFKNAQLLKQGLIDTNYYFLAQVSSKLIALLVIPVFARILSLEQFAAYDLFTITSGFLVLVAGLGMDSGVAIKVAENRDEPELLPGLLVTTIGISSMLLITIWGLAVIFYYAEIEIYPVSLFFINGLFVYTIFYQYSYNIYNFVRWLGDARKAALINFASSVLGILGGLLFLLLEPTLEYYISGSISGSFLGAILSSYNGRNYLKFRLLSRPQFKDLMALSLPYLPTYLSNYLLQFIDRIIISSTFGLGALGLYALINRIGSAVLFALQIISNGFRPIILANYQNKEGQQLSRNIFRFFWMALIPVTLLAILLSKSVILLFGGDQYRDAIPILPYIVVSVFFWSSFFLFGFGYQIKRRTTQITIITMGIVTSVYLLSFPLIKFSGIAGVAQATFISTAIGSILYTYFSERLFSFGYNMKLMIVCMIISTTLLLTINN